MSGDVVCPECHEPCTVVTVDNGIGAGEYWGAPFYDSHVVMTAGPARRHIVSRSAREPSGPRLGAIRGWLHRSDKGYGNHTE